MTKLYTRNQQPTIVVLLANISSYSVVDTFHLINQNKSAKVWNFSQIFSHLWTKKIENVSENIFLLLANTPIHYSAGCISDVSSWLSMPAISSPPSSVTAQLTEDTAVYLVMVRGRMLLVLQLVLGKCYQRYSQ